jgi:hypothetical protein
MTVNDNQLSMRVDTATALSSALDLFARLCQGQLEVIEEMCRFDELPFKRPGENREDTQLRLDKLKISALSMKLVLGFDAKEQLEPGSQEVTIAGRRAWEIKRALSCVVALHKNPCPDLRCPSVRFQDRGPRITMDPPPAFTLSGSNCECVIQSELSSEQLDVVRRATDVFRGLACGRMQLLATMLGKGELPTRLPASTRDTSDEALAAVLRIGSTMAKTYSAQRSLVVYSNTTVQALSGLFTRNPTVH